MSSTMSKSTEHYVHEMIEPNSMVGYPLVGINAGENSYIYLSKDHFVIECDYYQKVEAWIPDDYRVTDKVIDVDLTPVQKWVSSNYLANYFHMVVYITKTKRLNNIAIEMNKTGKFFEMSFRYSKGKLIASRRDKRGIYQVDTDEAQFLLLRNILTDICKTTLSPFIDICPI